ncbi:class II aldolase/adducin family protein [Halocatena marina]|uniref:Class II aldolase/adducin family protein n=1 Tax=Halocatena marina TaxID=2934937 RepID=A0ABD5YUE6_9EURY|nr:class II aldolase/adducin family protein [Halocatena marina]
MTEETTMWSEREQVSELGKELIAQGLANGTMGNLSERSGDCVAVSPSGVSYEDVTPERVPVVTLEGEQIAGDNDPSSETPMHCLVYEHRDDVGGVVHTHSPYATTFASLGQAIPASHYLIGFAGHEVPVTDYGLPGSTELGRMAAATLGDDYQAVLLKHHGVITVGETLDAAFEIAQMVEYCARIHYQALNVGDPEILPEKTVDDLINKFRCYGRN